MRRSIHQKVNTYRRALGKNTLQAKNVFNSIAQEHAEDMAAGRSSFSHNGFKKRVKKARAYFPQGLTMGENLYTSNYPVNMQAERCVEGWKDSPGHDKNLRGNFQYTGIGVARSRDGHYFIVQIYMK
ncbi:MAG: CAP domain-containing protein [Bacteroidota bacterium]